MVKNLLKILKVSFVSFWSLIYFVLGAALIFYISFLFGHPILDGVRGIDMGVLVGNDSAFALSLVYWFDRYFPKVPIWYPLQGMGVSLLYSYPMGTTFLILVLERLLGMSAVEVFRMLSFLTFPLTALGIYFLAWVRLKQQTVALIAAIFFLLSQASWLFQTLHGIFAQSFSLIFVAPILLFYDLFLERLLKGQSRRLSTRLIFVVVVLFMGLVFLVHVVTATMVSVMLVLWSVLRFWFAAKGGFSFTKFVKRALAALIPALSVVVLGAAIAAFWLIPFQSYSALANKEGLNTRSLSQLQEESLRLPSLLGIEMLGEGIYRYDFFFFATPVLIFFAIGFLTALIFKKKRVFGLALISIFFIILTMVPIYTPFLASLFKFFFTTVYFRGLIPVVILLPIVAGWGAWSLPAGVLLVPFNWLTKKLGKKRVFALRFAVFAGRLFLISIVGFFSVAIVYWSVKNLAHQPPPNPDFPLSYKYQFQAYGPSLSESFQEFFKNPGPFLTKLPKIDLSKEGMEGKTVLNEALEEWFDIDETTILDVSPYAAGGAIMQGVGLVSDTRFTNLYHYYASLIHGMWGYQAGVFYGKEPLYKSERLLADLTDWFGIKYAVVVPGFDPFEKYEKAGWKPKKEFNEYSLSEKEDIQQGSWGIEVWENPRAQGLYSVRRRPVILVITDFKRGGYDHVFRTGNLGSLTYADAWVIEGGNNISDYTLDELFVFDGIILHGYSYRGKSQAWSKLARYVEQGGKLFVDTGWQFVAEDWGNSGSPESDYSLPEPFPVRKTRWSNIGTSWDGAEVESAVSDKVDFSSFDPPLWNGNPWGMSLASMTDLREGSMPILWKGDRLMMAKRTFGQGEIVWSGINIFSHITQNFNEAEADFLREVLEPLFSQTEVEDIQGVGIKREGPDEVVFAFAKEINEPFWLLFRESNSPYWRATKHSAGKITRIPIYSAGPGFVLMRLDSATPQDTLYLNARLSFKDGILAKSISASTLLFLIVYLAFGQKIKLPGPFNKPINASLRIKHKAKITVDEEEVY